MSKYVAQPFKAAPNAMVLGQTMQAFLENVQADLIQPILKSHNITSIDVDTWYSHQLWMDILQGIQDLLGGNAQSAFVAFGRSVVEKAAMPPEINTIPIALNALHAIHHMNLKNVPADEGYFIEKLDEQHFLVYENTPNPTDAIYGFLWGICARFKSPGQSFTVRIVENSKPDVYPGTVYDIQWS